MTETLHVDLTSSLLSLPDIVGCDFGDDAEFRAVYAKKISELIDMHTEAGEEERANTLKGFFSEKLDQLDLEFCKAFKSHSLEERFASFNSDENEETVASTDTSVKDEL